MEIYGLLENNKAKQALKLFKSKKTWIMANMDSQTYTAIEAKILDAKNQPRRRKKQESEIQEVAKIENGAIKPIPRQQTVSQPVVPVLDATKIISDIYELIEKGETLAADSNLTAYRQAILSAAPPEVFNMLKESVLQAMTAEKELRNQDIARGKIAAIYELLEQGLTVEAGEMFNTYKEKLRKYAGEEPFMLLEQTVNGSLE
jgi:hypothetical protein